MDTVYIIVGSILFAVGLDCFEIPNGIAAGGASGLATVIAELLRRASLPVIPVGMQVLAMNVLLMGAVLREGGARYAARCILGIVVSSVATDALAPVLPVLGNGDMLLCALWGGVVCGLGLGLVFRAGGNTGGTDIVAQIAAAHTSLSTGVASLVADAAVIAAGTCGFGMGATPNAMANMQVICEKFAPSVKAYLLIPIIGSLFADFINSLVITFFINLI